MAVVAMKQLLEAGVHFGHQTRRWDPRMAPYIFTARNGIYIIDLQKTAKKIDEAYAVLKSIVDEGKTVIFVGTKKQAQECVKEEAERCGMYYVNQRWLGGMLTNFKTIRTRVNRLKELEAMAEDGTFDVLPKKERIAILEARKLGIPVIGLVDTNCNPEDVDYVIPGNDDAIRAIKLIIEAMANAVIESKQGESMVKESENDEETTMEEIENTQE